MKKIYALILFCSVIVNAQIVNIPDANFKSALIVRNGVDTNNNGEIEVAEAQATEILLLDNEDISDLTGIAAFPNLFTLFCFSNNLTVLDVSNMHVLRDLDCSFNQITSLNCSNSPMLNGITCSHNPLTNFDISGCVGLNDLFVAYTNLTTLDLTDFPNLLSLTSNYNPMLVSLLVKNGSNEHIDSLRNFAGCPNLSYVCFDESQYTDVVLALNSAGLHNTVANSYCSFAPGGNYNTIAGNIAFDFDNNGCDLSDNVSSFFRINVSQGNNQQSTFTDIGGTYEFYTLAGTFNLTPAPENASLFTISPTTATVSFDNPNNNSTVRNFCITPNGVHPDLDVLIIPITRARPGFNATYRIVYHNKGNQIQSGQVNFTFDDEKINFNSASPAVDVQSTGLLKWNFSNLKPFESRGIMVNITLNSPLDVPPLVGGEILNFASGISVSEGEATPLDNAFDLNQTVVNSNDPNNKTCLEGDTVSPDNIGKYLHYNINFENTGTADAINIVVKDVIDTTKFDISTLQVLDASHPVATKVNGNKVEFIFQNINLPPAVNNSSIGHGNVAFKIKTKSDLTVGTEVTNVASIYFDYNAPILTNVAQTTFAALATPDFVKDNSVTVYPNPTKNSLQINAKNNIKSIALFDIQGRILQSVSYQNTNVTLDISAQQRGVYFLKINTEKGSKIEKIIKQ